MKNIEQLKKLTGGLKKKNDPSVWNYKSILENASRNDESVEFPATFRLWDSEIKNQQDKGTCAAHAMASAMEILEYYDTGDRNQFSTSWYYGYRQATDAQEEGMYLTELLENARKIGGVHKSLMPDNLHYSDSHKMIENMKEQCLKEAKDHRIKNYAEIENPKDIINAIYYNNSPVIIGAMIYESFYTVDGSGIVPNVNYNKEKCYGGHAMLCIGWTTIKDDLYLVVKNSWGEDWGDNGYCYFKVNSELPFFEMYILFDEQNYKLDFSDVEGRWSESYIEQIVRMGLINGYDDGTFKPQQYITREEISAIISRLMNKFKYL